MLILQIAAGVFIAQAMRAVVMGVYQHVRELRSENMRDPATGEYMGSSLWIKMYMVY